MDSFTSFDTAPDFIAHHCEELRAPGYLNLSVSIFIVLGILVSYLPQHYRIISRGTSEGISPYFVLLGTTSSTCAFANILFLPESRADVACCKAISTFECVAGLLGIAQIGVQWFCFTVILFLFLVFFPRGPTLPDNDIEDKYTWRSAVTVGLVCLLHGFIVIIITAFFAFVCPGYLEIWAHSQGVMAVTLALIQYMPQIWMTWRLGHVGSLSIPMMLIQTPGSFVLAASLAARLGWGGWSNWGMFLVTGSLQGCLLVMGISYEIKARREKSLVERESTTSRHISEYTQDQRGAVETDDEGSAVVEDGSSERTPLLSGSQKSPRASKHR